MSLKSRIEAVLFLTDKPLKAQAVARIVNEDVQLVRQAVIELINDYEQRQGALEIADDEGYIIQVKDQYGSIIDEFMPMELPISLVRTLSAIAIKQPVMQSEIIKIRGAGAYDHVKELLERELIIKKEEGGRSPTLSTTKKFQEYFRLSQDAKSLRGQLKQQVKAEELLVAQQLAAEQGLSPELGTQQLTFAELADATSLGISEGTSDGLDNLSLHEVPAEAFAVEKADSDGVLAFAEATDEASSEIIDLNPDAEVQDDPIEALTKKSDETTDEAPPLSAVALNEVSA